MRARHARRIRRGILLARQARDLVDGIAQGGSTFMLLALGSALLRIPRAAAEDALTYRAFHRTVETLRSRRQSADVREES